MSLPPKSEQPLTPNTAVRVIVLAGMAVVLAAPFLSDWAAYLEGRRALPFLAVDVWLMLIWSIVGCGTFVVILTSHSLFEPGRRKYRFLLAFGLLGLGPVYFFLTSHPPAEMYLRGMAAAAKAQVNVESLQKWAVTTVQEAPSALKPSSDNSIPHAPLDWSKVPADVRQFLGGTKPRAFYESNSEGQIYVAAYGSEARVLAAGARDLTLATNAYWSCRLIPGVFLEHRVRPQTWSATRSR